MRPEDVCIGQNCRVSLICQSLWRGNGTLYLRLYHLEQLWGSQFLNSASIHPTLTDWQIDVNGCGSKLQSRYYRQLALLVSLNVGCFIIFMHDICFLTENSDLKETFVCCSLPRTWLFWKRGSRQPYFRVINWFINDQEHHRESNFSNNHRVIYIPCQKNIARTTMRVFQV